MGADEGCKTGRGDGLVCEDGNELVDRVVDVRQQTVGASRGRILAADQGLDSGPLGAHEGAAVGGELDQVRHTNAILLVLVEPSLGLSDRILQTVIEGALDLGRGENNGAVSTTARTGSDTPAGGIVEAEANGGAGGLGTSTSVCELGCELVSNVLPDAALVGGAFLAAESRNGSLVLIGRLSRGRGSENILDILTRLAKR